jgi:gas vesicle protein
MADSYDRYENEAGGGGFMMGLLTGTVLGAGLGMLLAPKAGSELRGAIGDQARQWSNTAAEQYRHAREAAAPWMERGRDMVNQARETATRTADQARETATRAADQARGYAGAATGSSYDRNTGSTYGGGNTGTSGSTGSTGGYGGSTPGGDYNRP